MSGFDPESFLQRITNQQGSTEFVAVPEGYYRAAIADLKMDVASTKDGDRNTMIATWSIDDLDGELEKMTGRSRNTVRQTFWLDLTEEGQLNMAKGRNPRLNLVREALGQNVAGRDWNPLQMLGVPADIEVTHSISDGRTFANVRQVLPVGELVK